MQLLQARQTSEGRKNLGVKQGVAEIQSAESPDRRDALQVGIGDIRRRKIQLLQLEKILDAREVRGANHLRREHLRKEIVAQQGAEPRRAGGFFPAFLFVIEGHLPSGLRNCRYRPPLLACPPGPDTEPSCPDRGQEHEDRERGAAVSEPATLGFAIIHVNHTLSGIPAAGRRVCPPPRR
jgi:hypothetical protein